MERLRAPSRRESQLARAKVEKGRDIREFTVAGVLHFEMFRQLYNLLPVALLAVPIDLGLDA